MKKSILIIPIAFALVYLFYKGMADARKAETAVEEVAVVEEPGEEQPIEKTIVVHTNDGAASTGVLYGIELQDNKWVSTFDTIICSIGKNGFAPPGEKMEGDGKTPSGSFAIGAAFGYADQLDLNREYIALKDHHHWISDTASSDYNRLVTYYPEGVLDEKMRRKDHLYEYGLIVEYNTDPVIKGMGSAIFVHVERRKGAPTAGCVAMSKNEILDLLNWIDDADKVLIDMGVRN